MGTRRAAFEAALTSDSALLRQTAIHTALKSNDPVLRNTAIRRALDSKNPGLRAAAIQAAFRSGIPKLQGLALMGIVAGKSTLTGFATWEGENAKKLPISIQITECDLETG